MVDGKQLVCKHLLAVGLAKGIRGFEKVRVVDDVDFATELEGLKADFVSYKEMKPRKLKNER